MATAITDAMANAIPKAIKKRMRVPRAEGWLCSLHLHLHLKAINYMALRAVRK